MAQFPENLKYTAEHEWVGGDSPVTVGITDTAQDALGDIVYLELPAVGDEVTAGAVIGEIESTKSVSELFSPVSGTVVEVNQTAVDDPALVNLRPVRRRVARQGRRDGVRPAADGCRVPGAGSARPDSSVRVNLVRWPAARRTPLTCTDAFERGSLTGRMRGA